MEFINNLSVIWVGLDLGLVGLGLGYDWGWNLTLDFKRLLEVN